MNRIFLGLKLAIIAGLVLILGVALVIVNGIISQRQQFRADAVNSIEASYAGPQQVIGPVLVRPYTQTISRMDEDHEGRKAPVETRTELTALSFPRALAVSGVLVPSERHHGLYSVPVFEFEGNVKADFEIVDPQTEGKVVWGEPYLGLFIADVRGIVGTPQITANGVALGMLQGAPASGSWQPDLRVPLRGVATPGGHLGVALALKLAGTQSFSVAPIGDSNHVELQSTWASPLFGGQFLPHTRQVSSAGFTSSWDVSSLASSAQANLQGGTSKPVDLMQVDLLNPIDPYKLSDRATKYGILFVLLTFAGFFLYEILRSLPIHPIQYLLVGLGLALFFLLLVSFSEHMPFARAYLIASIACIGLLTFYLSYVLRGATQGLGFGAMLTTLYAAVYGLLISEDNSLILGSLLLFAMLAAIMILTRKIDWYHTGMHLPGNSAPSPPPPAKASPTQSAGTVL